MAKKQQHILVIPFPSQGHLLPLLDLVHHLSMRHVSLTIAVTPKNLSLLSPLISSSSNKIETLVLPFPSHPSLPHGVENSQDLSLSLFPTFMHNLIGLKGPILSWAQSNPKPVSIILSDSFLGWTQQIAEELNIPRIIFAPNGLLFAAISHLLWVKMPKRPDLNDDNYPVSFPEVQNCPIYHWYQLSWLYRNYIKGDPDSEFIRENFLLNLQSSYLVSNSFYGLEGGEEAKQSIKNLGKFKQVWAVGPLSLTGGSHDVRGSISCELATWLDKCPNGSVVYICFGSQSGLSDEQAKAVAEALELSQVFFVWAVRGSSVPNGFETQSAHRGRVIRGWAPQIAILNHPSVGWFLTHCGWNSVLEAITAEVAMLTWPMGTDQFCNARLLTETNKMATRVAEGAETVPDVVELSNALKGIDTEEGMGVRERARELGKMAKEAVREGGSSWRDLEGMVLEMGKISE